MNKNVSGSEISVVIQGAIDSKHTRRCIKSVQFHLPGCETILSTWENSPVDNINVDKIILSRDPGASPFDFTEDNRINNVNRQIVSTQAGVQEASRKYCLKLRSDAYLKGDEFLNFIDKFPIRDKEFSIFAERILTASIYSRVRSDLNGFPTPFHPSDFWMFGLTPDVKKYFLGIPLVPEDELGFWICRHPNRVPDPSAMWRFAPEQYFLVSCLKREFHSPVNFDDWSDWNITNITQSNKILSNNFVVLGARQSGIYNLKHSSSDRNESAISGLITHFVFENMYKEYCDKDYQPLTTPDLIYNLRKNFRILRFPIGALKRWVSALVKFIVYSVLIILSKIR